MVHGDTILRSTSRSLIHGDRRIESHCFAASHVLEKRIDLNYKGVIGDISRRLNEIYPAIGPQRGSVIEEAFDDGVTQATITAKQCTIRDILTDAVPTEAYGPLLWRAWTKDVDGQRYTEVQFYGPRRQR